MHPTSETIQFEFTFELTNYRQEYLPYIKIFVDEEEKYSHEINKDITYVKFDHTCAFGMPHRLKFDRSGTDPSGHQMLVLQQLKIDGINIQNIVWSRSVTIPEYPEPWASEQKAANIVLPEELYGTTHFGHNCTWYLDFTSPFYIYIMKWMGGGIHDRI